MNFFIVKSKGGEVLNVIDLSKVQDEKLVVVKDKDGAVLQYIEFDSLNPTNTKMAIKDKDKNLLQTVEIFGQEQKTIVKDKMGNVQFTSQVEGDKIIVRDAQGKILKEMPKSEIQSQMPNSSLSHFPATSTLPLTLSPSFPSSSLGTQIPPNMELPPYLRQQMNRPRTLATPQNTIPEWNPDFILNSTFTSCCGCNWCGCGGTGGSCVDPNVKCGGPPPPPTDPCNDPCSPPPTNTSGMAWAAPMCQPCPPGTVRQPDGSCKPDKCQVEKEACDIICFSLGLTCTLMPASHCKFFKQYAPFCWIVFFVVCLGLGEACIQMCKTDYEMCK